MKFLSWVAIAVWVLVWLLVSAIVWALLAGSAHAAETAISTTGIPIEWLFGLIAALVAVIYVDMKRELRALRRQASRRAGLMLSMKYSLQLVCRKLDIPFNDEDDDLN